ncbi:MAG: class I SAM-dependent methyltransferase [Pseudomonadota bacterium]
MSDDWPGEAFFTLHHDLPREGPGEAADVAWAVSLAGLRPDGVVCDAACATGGDIAALLDAVPKGRVVGFDLHQGFVDTAGRRFAQDPRVNVLQGQLIRHGDGDLPDPRDLVPFDLIWCAGACNFEGVTECLEAWKTALRPGGAVAFSEVAWFHPEPPEEVRAFWAEYPAMTDEAGVTARIEAAGYEILGQRRLSDAAWEAYYRPLDQRVAALRPTVDAELAEVLDASDEEARMWRTYRDVFGYVLSVVRPR